MNTVVLAARLSKAAVLLLLSCQLSAPPPASAEVHFDNSSSAQLFYDSLEYLAVQVLEPARPVTITSTSDWMVPRAKVREGVKGSDAHPRSTDGPTGCIATWSRCVVAGKSSSSRRVKSDCFIDRVDRCSSPDPRDSTIPGDTRQHVAC